MTQVDNLAEAFFEDGWKTEALYDVVVSAFVADINEVKATVLPVDKIHFVVAPLGVPVAVQHVLDMVAHVNKGDCSRSPLHEEGALMWVVSG